MADILDLKASDSLRRILEENNLAYDDEGDVLHIVTDTGTATFLMLAGEELAHRGIVATVEYPGFLHLRVPGTSLAMNWGDVNGVWDFDLVNVPDDGLVHDHGEETSMPLNNDPIAVANHIACTLTQFVEGRK